jgi:hypothetical protein
MSQALGKATIRVDGLLIDTMEGAKLNIGGDIAQTKTSSRSVHRVEKLQPSRLEAKIVKTGDVSVADIRAWRDVAITFEGDDGRIYTVPKAWTAETPEFDDKDGEIMLVMEGEPAEEHG